MSALALQFQSFTLAPRPFSEVELLRAISHTVWNAKSEEDALKTIAAAILRVQDLTGFRVEPTDGAPHLPLYEATIPQPNGQNAWALAPISAYGKRWGQVRIFFLPQARASSESPVRLAKFVGQQLAILLDRLEVERQNYRERARLYAFESGNRRRKAIHRAAAILAQQRGVSTLEATRILVQYARAKRKRLLPVAESLIFGFDALASGRPTLRRLAAIEPTTYFESAKGSDASPHRSKEQAKPSVGELTPEPLLRGIERSIA
jgi:hypothetical protein